MPLGERALVSLGLLLLGVALMASTVGGKFADLGGAFSPHFFPRVVLVLWIALAALDLFLEVRQRTAATARPLARVAVLGMGFVVYALVMMPLGFFLASLGFCAVCLWVADVRQPLPLLAMAIGLPAALVFLFNHVLTLPLPTSPFTHLF